MLKNADIGKERECIRQEQVCASVHVAGRNLPARLSPFRDGMHAGRNLPSSPQWKRDQRGPEI